MNELTEVQQGMVTALASRYFDVVPEDLRTYCSVTAKISSVVLQHYGIESNLLPCQIWYVAPHRNFVIGFLGNPPTPGKWDGHVVCRAGNWIIDAALHHFKVDWQLEVPPVVAARTFGPVTQVISRIDVNNEARLWWHPPPTGADLNIPPAPLDLVSTYSSRLINLLAEAAV